LNGRRKNMQFTYYSGDVEHIARVLDVKNEDNLSSTNPNCFK
jgi:hypothetical protein